MRMSAFGRTDKGKRRSNNEDDLALVDLTEGRALPDQSAEHLRVGETILTSSLVRLPQRRGTFGYDAQRYPSAARRLRPVRCKGLLEGRPVWSPVPAATNRAAPAKRPQVLRNASRSTLSWSLCVYARPWGAPG